MVIIDYMNTNPYSSPSIPASPLAKERVRFRRIVIAVIAAIATISVVWLAVFFAQSVMPERRYIDLSNPDATEKAMSPAEKLQELLP